MGSSNGFETGRARAVTGRKACHNEQMQADQERFGAGYIWMVFKRPKCRSNIIVHEVDLDPWV
jgi:hypothetical protein